MQVGRVEVDVGELDMVQGAGAERADRLIEPGTDPRYFGLADPGATHRFDEVVNRASADAMDVSLHHDCVQSLVDAAAGLEDDREERALTQLGDPQFDVTGRGGQHPRSVTVAFGDTVLGALIGGRADMLGRFQLDELLERDTNRLADQVDALPGTERLKDLGQGRLGHGHRWDLFR